VMKRRSIKDKILDVMADKRPRTLEDLAIVLDIKKAVIRPEIYNLVRKGALKSRDKCGIRMYF